MAPKYRHRGYRENEQENRERSGPPPRQNLTREERIQRRSLRHAIDREANEVLRCHVCGRNVQNSGAIGFDTRCPHCSAELHCCRTCKQFNTAARWQCDAEIDEPVNAKSDANTCTHYQPSLVLDVTGRRSATPGRSGPSDPKSQFENLFKR